MDPQSRRPGATAPRHQARHQARHRGPTSGPAQGPGAGPGAGPDIWPGTGTRHQARHRGPAHPTPRHPGRALWTARGCNPPRPVPDSAMPHHAPTHHAPPRPAPGEAAQADRNTRLATLAIRMRKPGLPAPCVTVLPRPPARPGKALCPAAGLAALITRSPARRGASPRARGVRCSASDRRATRAAPEPPGQRPTPLPAPRPAGGMTGGQRPVPCRSGRRRGAFPAWPFGARGDRQTPRPRPRPPRRGRPKSRQAGPTAR